MDTYILDTNGNQPQPHEAKAKGRKKDMSTYETKKARSEAANAARLICNYDRNTTFADYETSAYAAHALEYIDIRTADAAAAADRALAAAQRATDAETAAADPEDLEEPAPIYQRYELLAYLGDPEDYDVDAIEAEATRFTADGARVWAAFGEELAAIAERHELYSYAPAI